MPTCFFATDLHGKTDRYDKLLASVISDRPAAVFLGGDLLPRSALSAIQFGHEDFIQDYLVPAFTRTRDALGADYPDIFLILGNDDPRRCEEDFVTAVANGLWHYVHEQKSLLGNFAIYGLAYVPPTPFLLKDWERYDVSRYVPPGCVSPEEGSEPCQPKKARSNGPRSRNISLPLWEKTHLTRQYFSSTRHRAIRP